MDNRVYLWLENQWQASLDKPHSSQVNSIAFNDDGNVMVTGGMDTWLRVWTRNPEQSSISTYYYRSCHKTTGDISRLCFLPDGNFLSVDDGGYDVKTWRLEKYTEPSSGRYPPVNSLKIQPVSSIGRKKYTHSFPVITFIKDVKIYNSVDGRFIAILSDIGIIEIWSESRPNPESESSSVFKCVTMLRFPIMNKFGKFGAINCAKLHPMEPTAIVGTRIGCQIMRIRNDGGTWWCDILDIPQPPGIKVMSVCLDDKSNQFAIATSSETPPGVLFIPKSSEIKIYSFSDDFGTYKHIKTLYFEQLVDIRSMIFESDHIKVITRTGSFSQ